MVKTSEPATASANSCIQSAAATKEIWRFAHAITGTNSSAAMMVKMVTATSNTTSPSPTPEVEGDAMGVMSIIEVTPRLPSRMIHKDHAWRFRKYVMRSSRVMRHLLVNG